MFTARFWLMFCMYMSLLFDLVWLTVTTSYTTLFHTHHAHSLYTIFACACNMDWTSQVFGILTWSGSLSMTHYQLLCMFMATLLQTSINSPTTWGETSVVIKLETHTQPRDHGVERSPRLRFSGSYMYALAWPVNPIHRCADTWTKMQSNSLITSDFCASWPTTELLYTPQVYRIIYSSKMICHYVSKGAWYFESISGFRNAKMLLWCQPQI